VLPLGVECPEQSAGSDHAYSDPVHSRPAGSHPAGDIPRPVQWLFLSRLHPKKQLPLLLEALALLRQRSPEASWQLHIAGDGEPAYVAQLRHQAAALGLEARIHWHGFVSGAAKVRLLQQADWFLLPSAAENFGIAVAEALAAGVPALLSPGVALTPLVIDAAAGYGVQPGVEDWANALAGHALQAPSDGLRQAARQLAADQFSWPAITTRLLAQYRQVARPCCADA